MIRKQFGFLKTTALGGLFFLFPLLVIAALVGQVVPLVLQLAESVAGHLPLRTPAGVAILFVVSVAIVVGLCFLAGLIARHSLGQRLSQWLERQLLTLFPRYAILRNQLAEKVGRDHAEVQMKPVLVRCGERLRLGFETDRGGGWSAVYFPGAPDTWAGYVVYLDSNLLEPLQVEFGKAVGWCERLGNQTLAELALARNTRSLESSGNPPPS